MALPARLCSLRRKLRQSRSTGANAISSEKRQVTLAISARKPSLPCTATVPNAATNPITARAFGFAEASRMAATGLYSAQKPHRHDVPGAWVHRNGPSERQTAVFSPGCQTCSIAHEHSSSSLTFQRRQPTTGSESIALISRAALVRAPGRVLCRGPVVPGPVAGRVGRAHSAVWVAAHVFAWSRGSRGPFRDVRTCVVRTDT